MDRLRDYSWPGNIRELQNVLRQALFACEDMYCCPNSCRNLHEARIGSRLSTKVLQPTAVLTWNHSYARRLVDGSEGLHAETLRWVERILLPLVLEHTQGNQRQAAKILGIARQTLRSKLRELGVTRAELGRSR